MVNRYIPGKWELQLERLHVAVAEDDGGDEPYLVLIGFRSTVGKPNSTQVFWSRRLAELGSGMQRGDEAVIPANIGVIKYGEVKAVDEITLLGAVVVAMESDATPFGAIEGLFDSVIDELELELRTTAENNVLDLLDQQAVNTMVNRIRDRIDLSIPQLASLWLGSWGDPDEIVGVQSLIYVEGLLPWYDLINALLVQSGQPPIDPPTDDPVLTRARPWEHGFSLLSEQTFDMMLNDIRFLGISNRDFADASYSVSGRMTSTVLRAGRMERPASGTNWWGSVELSVSPYPGGHPLSHVHYKARYDKGDGQGEQVYDVLHGSPPNWDGVWDISGIPPQQDVEVWAELISNQFGGSVESDIHRIGINIETTPPTGQITLPIAGSFHGRTMQFTADVSDTQSGVDRVEFMLRTTNGPIAVPVVGTQQNNFSVTWDIVHLEEQVVSVGATAYDRQGNSAILAEVPNVTIDHTPPDVTVLHPSPDPSMPTWIRATGIVTLRTQVEDSSSVQEVSFTAHYRDRNGHLGPHPIGTVTSPGLNNEFAIGWRVSQIPDQADRGQPPNLYIQVTAMDSAGNVSSGIGWIAGFDRAAPDVRIVDPFAPTHRRGGILDIEVKANDDLGVGQAVQELVVSARYKESSTAAATRLVLATLANVNGWVGTLDLDPLPEQTLSVTATATDEAGNSIFVSQHITIDRTAPLIAEVGHSPEPFLAGGGRSMSIRYRLAERVQHVNIMILDQTGNLMKALKFQGVPPDPQVAVWDGRDEIGNLVPAGDYTYTMEVIDRAGNIASHPGGTFTVMVDPTPPQLRIVSLAPAPFSLSAGQPLRIAYEQNEEARAEVEVLHGTRVIRYLGALLAQAGRYYRHWDGSDAAGQRVAAPETYEIQVRATDPAGNTTEIAERIYVVA